MALVSRADPGGGRPRAPSGRARRRAHFDRAHDRARFDRITKRILRAILDGRFVSASHEMQRALHRLRALR